MNRYKSFLLLSLWVLCCQPIARADSHGENLDAIILGFSNKDPALQYEARRALASYVAGGTAPDKKNGAEKVTQELLAYLKGNNVDPEAKKYIIRDLSRVGTGTAVDPLSKIMGGKDARLAESARQALEQIDDPKATAAIKTAIKTAKDNATRQIYLRTLANRRDPGTLGFFINGLQSDDTVLAFASVYALTKLNRTQATEALEKSYLSSPAAELKHEMESSLVTLDKTSEKTLLKIHESGLKSATRQAALVRLVSEGRAVANSLLKAAIMGSDADLRASAIRLALSHGKQSLVKNHADHFSSDDWRIVLGGLQAFEGKGAEDLAIKALEEGDAGIQAEALRALGAYGSNQSIDRIIQHFSGRDKELKQAASHALARMTGTALNNRLNQMLNSDSSEEAAIAIEALAYRSLPNSKNRLFRFVNGDDSGLAREALKTLSVTADEEDLYRLLFLSRRSDDALNKLITGMLKKVVPEIGSLELQAKVKAL